MTLYLLDANVLIRAHVDYYPIDRIPRFWEWLVEQGQAGRVKMPEPIYQEIYNSPGLLGPWLRQSHNKKAIILDEPIDARKAQHVTEIGYASDLDDVEQETIGKDPFLVASALGHTDRVVISKEVSRPSKKRANRKVPDVCAALGIECHDDFWLWKALDFRIP